ncbi:Protein of unknown function [Cotesia congregata]|uniref:Uncharacterized protein n=1 Tax=Cotesia congregata TaxID=51543 RepID=A0A8J2HL40_COTCN|nr:Protein of unknown function [Cotesia congregata]
MSIMIWTQSKSFQIMSSMIDQKLESILLEPCIFKKLNPIIVSNDIRDIINASWIKEGVPKILIGPSVRIDNSSTMFLPTLPTYLLSTNKLQEVLRKVKSSSWWNIDSRFLIVDIFKICNDAWNIFQTMWKMNLLSSLLICQDKDDLIAIYTYNPYANYAPYPWQHVNTTFNERHQQWTLFKRHDSKGQYGCSNLFFDKTKHLNGSEVIAEAIIRLKVTTDFEKAYNISSIEKKMPFLTWKCFYEIFSVLNVTPIIHYFDLSNPHKIGNQTTDGFFNNLADSTCDITLNFLSLVKNFNSYSFIYPRHTGTYSILTRRNKVVSYLDEIGSVFSINVLILTALIFILTFIVLLVCKKLSFGSALLEILRLTMTTSTVVKFYRLPLRIFIVSILLFVIIMNANYQGHMSAYSTKLYREKINSIADLKKFKYSIFMTRYIGQVIGVDEWTETEKKYVHYTKNVCHDEIINSYNFYAACISTATISVPVAIKHNLHASILRTPRFVSPFIRKDWPLETRVDVIMSRLTEAGFLYYWESTEISEPMKKLRLKEVRIFDTYREIIMSDVEYIFVFLATSLAISFIVFLVEICYEHCNN